MAHAFGAQSFLLRVLCALCGSILLLLHASTPPVHFRCDDHAGAAIRGAAGAGRLRRGEGGAGEGARRYRGLARGARDARAARRGLGRAARRAVPRHRHHRPARRRQINARRRPHRPLARGEEKRRRDRGRSLVAALRRRLARRPHAAAHRSRGPRDLHPLDGGARALGRARGAHLSRRRADACVVRRAGHRNRRRRPIRDRDRRRRRHGAALPAARLRAIRCNT